MADGAKVRTVSELMSPDVLTASPSETIADATARMRDRKVGSVVVVDGSRPVGILTERDLVKITADGTDTAIAKVSEWMTENPDTVTPDVEVRNTWATQSDSRAPIFRYCTFCITRSSMTSSLIVVPGCGATAPDAKV